MSVAGSFAGANRSTYRPQRPGIAEYVACETKRMQGRNTSFGVPLYLGECDGFLGQGAGARRICLYESVRSFGELERVCVRAGHLVRVVSSWTFPAPTG